MIQNLRECHFKTALSCTVNSVTNFDFFCFFQCPYAIEEDSEGDNDSEEFYYGGQVLNCLLVITFIYFFLEVYGVKTILSPQKW